MAAISEMNISVHVLILYICQFIFGIGFGSRIVSQKLKACVVQFSLKEVVPFGDPSNIKNVSPVSQTESVVKILDFFLK